jgi:hypothetical protein
MIEYALRIAIIAGALTLALVPLADELVDLYEQAMPTQQCRGLGEFADC